MIAQVLGASTVILVTMGGWFALQAVTRRTCRGNHGGDVLDGLQHGCGGCSSGNCKRRGGQGAKAHHHHHHE